LLVFQFGILCTSVLSFLNHLITTDHYIPKDLEMFRITTLLKMGLTLLLFLISATFISIRNDKITKITG
jgi:hypothetical protein